ncbi:hypothetical protein [Planktothrix sp.]|uniref:hypothetical protein n=1 Tax=Planktothrix sp. TaxID=3088171 RepID=UPI0038D515C3
MTTPALSPAQANLKLALWQVDADSMSSSDLFVWLNDSGLPLEVTTRLHQLVTYTKKAGHKVIAIGKIILIKIIEFVQANRNLVMGMAVGVAAGFLANAIPFVGPFLAPIATLLGVSIGAISGHQLDQGYRQSDGITAVAQSLIRIAQEFFKLFIDVINIVFNNVVTA